MGISDIYYNIEDKWYDFLDFLKSNRIPVYKVVDPVENAGIPTLPIFVALLLIAGYFIFSGAAAPPAPPGIEVTVEVFSEGSLQPDASVAAFLGSKVLNSTSTDKEGKARLTVQPGYITFLVKKSKCQDANQSVSISSAEPPKKPIQINITCEAGAVVSFQQIKMVDQDGKALLEGRATFLDAENRYIGEGKVVGGVLNISKADYDRMNKISLLSDCVSTVIYKSQLTLSNTITVDCKTNLAVENASLTVTTYFGSTKVSNIGVRLEAEGGAIIDAKKYTEGGSATFSVGKNVTFRIKTDATSEYESYTSEKMSITRDTSQNIYLVKGTVYSTISVYDASTNKPLSGARLTILDGNDTKVEEVMTSASKTSALRPKDYTVVLFRDGYARLTGTLTGGQNRNFSMQPLEKNKTGSLSAFVYEKESGRALSGISVNAFDEGGVVLGTGAAFTDSKGLAFFSGIPAMKVKPVAYKGVDAYKPSPETVEIREGMTALVNIPVPLKQFNLSITVVDQAGAFVQAADVYLYDYKSTLVSSGRTDVRGDISFTITESKKYYVVAARDDPETKVQYRTTTETFTVVADISKTIVLRPVEANVSFAGFYTDPGLQNKITAPNVLQAGNNYFAGFSVGLPDAYNETVFEITSDSRYAIFPEYGDIANPGSTAIVENKSDHELKVTWKNYANNTENIKIKVFAKAAVDNSKLDYKATWKRADKTETKTGSIAFNVTKSAVDCEVKNGICIYRSISNADLKINDGFTVNFLMRYEGFKKLNEPLLIADVGEHVQFSSITLSPAYAYDLKAHEINITGVKNNMSAGEKVEGNITGKAVKGGKLSRIELRVGSDVFKIEFNVTGTQKLTVSPDKKTVPCADGKVTTDVTVTATETGEPVKGATVKSYNTVTTNENGVAKDVTVTSTDTKITAKTDDGEGETSLSVGACPGDFALSPDELKFDKVPDTKEAKGWLQNRGTKSFSATLYAPTISDFEIKLPTTSITVEPGKENDVEIAIPITAKKEGTYSREVTITMNYGGFPSEGDSIKLIVDTKVTKPTEPPTALAAPSAIGKVLHEDTFKTNLTSVDTIRAMMNSNYTGTKHALEAIYYILNFTNGTVTSGSDRKGSWVVLNIARIKGLGSTDIRGDLCAKRGKQLQPIPQESFCGDLIDTNPISGQALKCGRYNVSLEVYGAGSDKGDYQWRVTNIKALDSKCLFENITQFAGFLDSVNVSADGFSDAEKSSLGTSVSGFLKRIWGFANCNRDGDACRVVPMNLVSSGDYVIVKKCSGNVTVGTTTDCVISGISPKANFTRYRESDIIAAAEVGSSSDNSRFILYVKDASDANVKAVLDALYGSYEEKPTALVTWDQNNKALYVSSAYVKLDSVAIPDPVMKDAPFNVSMVYNSSRGINGTVYIAWNKSIAEYVANYTYLKDDPDNGYLSSARGESGDFAFFRVSVKQGTAINVTLKVTKLYPAELPEFGIRFRAWENSTVYCQSGTDYLRYPIEGTCDGGKCAGDANRDNPECTYKTGKANVGLITPPKPKLLVDLLLALSKACELSDAGQSKQYGESIGGDDGRPYILRGVPSLTAGKISKYLDEKCTLVDLNNFSADDWNKLFKSKDYTSEAVACTEGTTTWMYCWFSDANCQTRIIPHDEAADWEYDPIAKDTNYGDLAMRWYEPGWWGNRECVVRKAKRPGITVDSVEPSTVQDSIRYVTKGTKFDLTLSYKSGFQSNGGIYVFYNATELKFEDSSPAPDGSPLSSGIEDMQAVVVQITGVSGDDAVNKVVLSFMPLKEGKTTIKYRASDRGIIVCNPLEISTSGQDWPRYPAGGECTPDCTAQGYKGNASCAAEKLELVAVPGV